MFLLLKQNVIVSGIFALEKNIRVFLLIINYYYVLTLK